MFLDKIICFLKPLKLCVESDRFFQLIVLDVVLCCIFELSLKSQNFCLKPNLVQVTHLIHLICSLTKIDQWKVFNEAERFTCYIEVFG